MSSDCNDPVKNLTLGNGAHLYYQDWKRQLVRLKYRHLIDHTSLIVSVQVVSGSMTKTLRALIDTGAAMPMVIRSGIFPTSMMQRSVWPVKFVTASGSVMAGGTYGLKLEVSLSVMIPDESGTDLVDRVQCQPLWAYEAELHSCDLIIGYPFLKGFGLAIDPGANSLIYSSVVRKARHHSTIEGEMEHESDFPSQSGVYHACVKCDGKRHLKQWSTSANSPCASGCSHATDGYGYHLDGNLNGFFMDLCRMMAQVGSLFGMLNYCLQLGTMQSFDSLGEYPSFKCRDSECACYDEKLVSIPQEIWKNSDHQLVAKIEQEKALWNLTPEISSDLSEDLLNLNPLQKAVNDETWDLETYAVVDTWVRKIIRFSELEPSVDAFASKGNQRVPRFWTKKDDAFKQDWRSEILWMNPPFSQLDRVLHKILNEEAQGILIVPCWKRFLWWTILESIALKWMDIPHDVVFYQTAHGKPLPQKASWTSRAVVFNAFGALRRLSNVPMRWISESEDVDEGISIMSFRNLLEPELELPLGISIQQAKRMRLTMGSQEVSEIFGVIESNEEHPGAGPFIQQVQHEYKDVLFETILAKDIDPELRGPYGVAHIELQPDAVPQKRKPFRMLGEKEEAFRKLIQKFLDRDWIEQSDSEWGSQAFLVSKPSAADPWRMVVDYRYVNTVTKDFPYPLPLIEDLICKEAQNRIWSIFDLESGFHQMHLAPESRAVTAFVTPWCNYQWKVLPMGIKQAPALFQRLVNWTLLSVPRARAYVDDILVGTPESESGNLIGDHLKDLCQVLEAFRKYKLTVKGVKVHLFKKMIKFCGHVLFDGKRKAAPSKLEALTKWTPDMVKTVTHLKGFLGLAQYYSQYVADFAKIALPLTELLKNRKELGKSIVWTSEMKVAFDNLKKQLLENVVLEIADPYKPYVLEVDASDYAVGGVLSQEDQSGHLKPVAFFSRKLEGTPGKGQVGWSIREKETYAIVLMLLKFRSWVASSQIKIKVLTDHESLQHWHTEDLNKMIGSVARRGRWHEFLSQFNLEVVYVPGKEHLVSDALSRWAYPASTDTQEMTFHGDSKAQRLSDYLDGLDRDLDFNTARVSVISRGVFQDVWKYDKSKWKTVYSDLKQYKQHDYCYLDREKLYMYGKLCVPEKHTEAVIEFYHHTGHPSGGKLLDMILHRYSFEWDLKDIHKFCHDLAQGCHICQAVKPSGKNYGTLDFCPIPSQVFSSLCMDFLSLPKVTGSDGHLYDSVFVVVDRLSGYILGLPCLKSGLTAESVAKMFIRHCVYLMGVPLEILSDNDSLITSKFFLHVCEQLGIEQHSAVIYRPKGNGRAERAVRSVIGILRLVLTELKDNSVWVDVLPLACFLQNSLPGVIGDHSPHQIVFGRDLILPGELPREESVKPPEPARKWMEKHEDLKAKVQAKLTKIHQKERDRYIKEHCLQTYEPGDKVLVKVLDKDRSKLDPIWMGPCEILRHVQSGRYTVKTPFGSEDHHMDSFKPYYPDLKGKSIPFHYYRPQTAPEDDNWQVEKILKHRTIDGRTEWLVKWKGYDKSTWESAGQFVGYANSEWREYNKDNNLAVTFD